MLLKGLASTNNPSCNQLINNAYLHRDEGTTQDNEKTWLEKVIEEAKREDDKKYVEIQDSLRSEIQQLRDKVRLHACMYISVCKILTIQGIGPD